MTALTLAQTVEAISTYTVGTGKDITTDQLSTLQALVTSEKLRLNPGFSGDELTKFEAYLILDTWENKGGTGTVTTEKTKDNSYTVKPPVSSSYWMDRALQMISEYQTFSCPESSFGNEYDGVERADIHMPDLSDGYLQPIYGSADDLGDR